MTLVINVLRLCARNVKKRILVVLASLYLLIFLFTVTKMHKYSEETRVGYWYFSGAEFKKEDVDAFLNENDEAAEEIVEESKEKVDEQKQDPES